MKKLFTSLMALTVALSATASINPIVKGAAPIKKSEKAISAKVSAIDKEQIAAEKMGKKVAVPTAKLAAPASINKAAEAPKLGKFAKSANIDVVLTGMEPSWEYYASSGDWYFGCIDETSTYIIRLDYLTSEDGKLGTYSYSDLDLDYSYLTDYSTGEKVVKQYVEEGLTFTFYQEGETVKLYGCLPCEDGNTYYVNGEWGPYVPKTFDFKATTVAGCTYYSYDTDWYIVTPSDDAKYQIYLDINTGDQSKLTGHWTTENMVEGYNKITVTETGDSYAFDALDVDIVVDSAYMENPKKAISIQGQAITVKGDTVNIDIYVAAPLEPKAIIEHEVVVYDVEWPCFDLDGGALYMVGDKEETMLFQIATKALVGEMTEENLYREYSGMMLLNEEDAFTVDHGTVNVSFMQESMELYVKASLVLSDTICHVFEFKHQLEINGQKTYEYTNLQVDDSWGALGILFFDASNDESIMSAYSFGDEFYCTLYNEMEDGEPTAQVDGVAVFDYEYDAATTSLKATLLGSDMVIYNIDAKFVIPAIEDTISVNIPNAELNNLIDDMGAFQVLGYSESGSEYVSLAIYAFELDGEWSLDEQMQDLKGYNYVVLDADTEDYKFNYVYTGSFTNTKTGETEEGYDKWHLEGELQAGAHWVKLSMDFVDAPSASGNEYDMEEDATASFTTLDIETSEFDEEEGYYFLRLYNGTEMFSCLIYTDTDEPEGVFPITNTYEQGTAQAGDCNDSSVYPAFYGTVTEDGYINVPLFLAVDGTITLSHNEDDEIVMICESTNTWGYSGKFYLNYDPTGIENVVAKAATKAAKNFKNGQIRIEKNGKAYNALGIEL